MTFSYDIATQVGQVRLEIGDSTYGTGILPDGTNLSDEEIQFYLTREGGVGAAVAGVCEMLSIRFSNLADIAIGPRRESMSQIAKAYSDRAKALRIQYGGSTGRAFSTSPVRTDGFADAAAAEEYSS